MIQHYFPSNATVTKRQKHTCPICEESALDSCHDSIYSESSCDA